MEAANSSNSRRGKEFTSNRRKYKEENEPMRWQEKEQFESQSDVPELINGVKNMAVDQKIPDLNAQPPTSAAGKVSGLNSFMDSSGSSGSVRPEVQKTDHLSILERLAAAKTARNA